MIGSHCAGVFFQIGTIADSSQDAGTFFCLFYFELNRINSPSLRRAGAIPPGPYALCPLGVWSSLRISDSVDGLPDTGHKESVEVLDEAEEICSQSNWEWKCSAQRSILHDKLITGVSSVL